MNTEGNGTISEEEWRNAFESLPRKLEGFQLNSSSQNSEGNIMGGQKKERNEEEKEKEIHEEKEQEEEGVGNDEERQEVD